MIETVDKSAVNWAELLTKSRNLKSDCEETKGTSNNEAFFSLFRSNIPHIYDLLQKYCNLLDRADDATKEEKKDIIVDTRVALRLALSCSSLEDVEARNTIVNDIVVHSKCHEPIVHFLSHKKGDSKCRVLASQLLSNLVTSHHDAAGTITSSLALSPSETTVADRIREGLSSEESSAAAVEPSWMDMMLSCAHSNNRQAMTGIVAALHNALLALENSGSKKPNNQHVLFASQVASNSMLVSTLLRQIISIQAVQQAIEKTKQVDYDTNHVSGSKEEESLADAATEWISLVLVKCCKLGLLPELLASAGGFAAGQLDFTAFRVVPEHVVLLECLQNEMESPLHGKVVTSLLGGEAGDQGVVETHVILARLYGSLSRNLPMDSIAVPDGQVDPDIVLKSSALVTTLELLSSSLGADNPALALTRIQLGGASCTLIPDAVRDLGRLVDTISIRNVGKKSREFYMSDAEQSAITALVQIVGNVCFRCRQNQDLVRSTSVPVPIHMLPPDGSHTVERNALHVVLSCTSLSHSCFTLREWAVVAIRNLLDNNDLNQAEVAKLEANQPVQSAELGDLGIRVSLDPKGKVSVEPTDKKPS